VAGVNGRGCALVQVLVMAKRPVPGLVKTRLVARYGPDGAAALAEAALLDTLDAVAAGQWARQTVAMDGARGRMVPAGFAHIRQQGNGLDERIAHACDEAFRRAPLPVVVIGADTPQATPALLGEAAERLMRSGTDAVIGAATDGGYWVLGLRVPARRLIVGVPMSQATTGFAQLARLCGAGLRVAVLPTLTDVDTPADVDEVARLCPGSRFAAVARALEGEASDAVAVEAV
jgi:rSAM/selenodomain-associated transferase 1